ncbi:RNA 2',3'-cyclic phosphodiesterase [Ornithinibacillus sp. 179-J 7C1 HS]|uniref:RNA 2',3'-cyclic phosphodiesterase n=1 Tax=Ornithinibacillus sp. 179-J 7C1 HS TaxID=3142384 RepID=UPI0039A14430
MGQSPHYFIAIPVPDDLKAIFATWQDDLMQKLSYKIWPHQDDLHITLKFLGAVEEEQLSQLQKGLTNITHTDFPLNVGSIGTFGKHDSPRVLWAGVDKTEILEELYKKIEVTATQSGFAKENRPYRPHITLAKKWTGNKDQVVILNEIKEDYTFETFHINVEEFVLYQIFPSKLPKYERVETYRLKRG